MCHLDTAQCRILKDSGRFLVKILWGLGLNFNLHSVKVFYMSGRFVKVFYMSGRFYYCKRKILRQRTLLSQGLGELEAIKSFYEVILFCFFLCMTT